jgi:hypothetical protein
MVVELVKNGTQRLLHFGKRYKPGGCIQGLQVPCINRGNWSQALRFIHKMSYQHDMTLLYQSFDPLLMPSRR